MLRPRSIRVNSLIHAGALEGDILVTPLMDDKGTLQTLVTLLAEAPDKVLAVRTEGGLLKETRLKAMVLHEAHVFLL